MDGDYVYTVGQEDAAGNLSGVSAPLAITLDRTGPAGSATPDLDPTSDSGSSNTGNITNDNTPTFTGGIHGVAARACVAQGQSSRKPLSKRRAAPLSGSSKAMERASSCSGALKSSPLQGSATG